MSWYNEKTDGKTKRYLEWALGVELEPDEEPGFYRIKLPDSESPREMRRGGLKR